ncbi:MAG: acetyl-CoA carboxylase biotin carboxyl carrier protein subunit [Lawsonibacter sp.]|nr:acetyl-CoA carboxylase biotin carboxyl carrier protein subunit [Lawsonibacter sp.]
MMLAMLMVVIYVISWVVQQIESKRKPVAAPAKAAPKPAAPKPAAAPAQDESELVAVMMAAVAEESGMPMGSFQITNIAPAVAAAPAVAIPAPVAAPAPAPAPVAAAPTAAAPAAGETAVKSPMPGNIFKVECSVGQTVNAGDVLVVLEAMKMEIEVSAPVAGTVKAVAASVGTAVNTDDLLVTIG